MGCGQSTESMQSKALDKQMKEAAAKEANKVKLLLLGAGESGKSTVFKQMKVLYGKGLTDEEATLITPVVHSNMITLLKDVMKQVTSFGRQQDVSLRPSAIFPNSSESQIY